MSKQSEAKDAQGYSTIPNTCSNCKFYNSEIHVLKGYFKDYEKEKNIRCSIGGFAVKKSATCNMHKIKVVEES